MSRAGRVLGIITARGGSKGVPGKNLADLAGRPLIAHTILAARQAASLAAAVVSTDDPAIRDTALAWGAEVVDRPPALATDTARSQDAVRHVLETVGEGYDAFALLQPTSPFRTAADIDACVALYRDDPDARSVISVCEVEHPPHKAFALAPGGLLTPLFDAESLSAPRQTLPRVLRQNGAVYVVGRADFLAGDSFYLPPARPHVMGAEASLEIDTPLDLRLARCLAADGG